jgi:hypothetical protein
MEKMQWVKHGDAFALVVCVPHQQGIYVMLYALINCPADQHESGILSKLSPRCFSFLFACPKRYKKDPEFDIPHEFG